MFLIYSTGFTTGRATGFCQFSGDGSASVTIAVIIQYSTITWESMSLWVHWLILLYCSYWWHFFCFLDDLSCCTLVAEGWISSASFFVTDAHVPVLIRELLGFHRYLMPVKPCLGTLQLSGLANNNIWKVFKNTDFLAFPFFHFHEFR